MEEAEGSKSPKSSTENATGLKVGTWRLLSSEHFQPKDWLVWDFRIERNLTEKYSSQASFYEKGKNRKVK